jgi:hypothetical protein
MLPAIAKFGCLFQISKMLGMGIFQAAEDNLFEAATFEDNFRHFFILLICILKLLSFAAVQLIFFVFKEINAFGQISFSSFSRDLTVLHRVLIVIIIMSNFLSSVCTITCCFVSSPNKSNLLNEMIFYR